MNREMIVGGTTAIKGRKCMAIKGRKSRRDDRRGNTGLGGLGWERGSRKTTAHGRCTSKRRQVKSARGEPFQRRTLRTWSSQGFSNRRKRREKIWKCQRTQVEPDTFLLTDGKSFNIRDNLTKTPQSAKKQKTRHLPIKD